MDDQQTRLYMTIYSILLEKSITMKQTIGRIL